MLSQGHRGAGIPIAALDFAVNQIHKSGIPLPLFCLILPPAVLSNPVAPVRPEAGVAEIPDYHSSPNR